MRLLAFLILFPFVLLPASADDLHDRFDQAVKQLRSDDAAERDKGSAELEAIAKEAPELVRPLAEDKDPEVKARAHEVLERLHLCRESEGKALFKKVEQKYAEARTVQYTATIRARDTMLRVSLKVSAKTGNLFRYEGTYSLSETGFKVSLVCDGTSLLAGLDGECAPEKASWSAGGLVRDGMVRLGLWQGMRYVRKDEVWVMSWNLPVECLESQEDEKIDGRPAKVVSYLVKVRGKDAVNEGGDDAAFHQKLWIDPEKEVVLKRETICLDGFAVTEIYSDTKFDEEIPDEKFALPKETKEK